MRTRLTVILLLTTLVAGCIGTDFLEENANIVDPRIEISPEVSAIEIGRRIERTPSPISKLQCEQQNHKMDIKMREMYTYRPPI